MNSERVTTWKGRVNVLLQRLFPVASVFGDKGLNVGAPHRMKEFE